MPSFGERQTLIDRQVIGRIGVQNEYYGDALFPRICFRLGNALHEQQSGFQDAAAEFWEKRRN